MVLFTLLNKAIDSKQLHLSFLGVLKEMDNSS